MTPGHIPGQAPYPRISEQHKLDSMGLRKKTHRKNLKLGGSGDDGRAGRSRRGKAEYSQNT